ncbi:unnamed protein product [Rotaria sp. Silwood1]|nr:unnamed protein product [Rotaria sp. Silwood1]
MNYSFCDFDISPQLPFTQQYLQSYSTTIPADNNHQDPLLNFNNDDDSGTYKTHLRQLQSFLKLNLKQKEEDKGNNEF